MEQILADKLLTLSKSFKDSNRITSIRSLGATDEARVQWVGDRPDMLTKMLQYPLLWEIRINYLNKVAYIGVRVVEED